ncbi:TonB family protein [Acetobacteraceae bacterium ESL0709]|nr:TonB family protein [Acetobacteraceae bacterium ESL0697]MDF7678854.1 TonB family protein [Acetobacteraceae bacterium ESL0709]
MKHYVAQQHRPVDYAIAIGVTCLIAGFSFFALNHQRAELKRATATLSPLQTTIIAQAPSQDSAAAPPPPAMVEPAAPYIPPPKLNIATPAKPIEHVTHKKPAKEQKAVQPSHNTQQVSDSQSQSAEGTTGKSATGKASGSPSPGDHSAGAVPINNVQPEYPPEAQEQSREGSVTAVCDILANGRPANCKLLKIRGGHDFAESALEFLNESGVRYQPAVMNGHPVVEHNHVLHIDFTLNDGMN